MVALGNGSIGVDVSEGTNNLIGGTAPGAGNVIAGSIDPLEGAGIWLGTTTGTSTTVTENVVQGNLIGTNKDGTAALPNRVGVMLHSGGGVANNTIGGTTAAACNVISGNQDFGVGLGLSSDNQVLGNFIGTDITGAQPLGNGGGVSLFYGSSGNTIGGTAPGESNVIAYSTKYAGISLDTINSAGGVASGDVFRGNSIHDNAGLGIDLGQDGVTLNDSHPGDTSGPNNWQNFPVLTAAYAGPSTLVTGTLHSTPNSTFTIDFYANPAPDQSGYGQGRFYLGSTTATTDSSGNASFTATGLGASSPGQWVSATATDPGGDTSEFCQDVKAVPAPTVLVLNPTASGAVTLAGNASVKIPGIVAVDSSSSAAISAGGNSQLAAATIDVLGGVKTSGSATVSPAATTGVSFPDLLAGLAPPSTTGLTNYGSFSLAGSSSQTINPGIYSQIKVSGGASLTLSPGTYIIEGGGLTVTGGASVTGAGVTIYNAGSNYPSSGGRFGGITLSGTGTFNLSAPTGGPYARVLIFQSRQNTRALSFSGNAMVGMSGTIYAANALLSLSGNVQLQTSLDVGMLNVSGNVALTQIAAGSDGSGDTSGIANTLLAGNLSVYINDPSGLFTSDELARIQDAINTWDALLAPYSVTITEVSDPSQANLVIDTGSTSAAGGAAAGVLGCYNAPNAEITILQGWNWYAGADASQIRASQYDFETTVLHELGHALGLGGSTDPSSPMYETLAAGAADRTPTAQDLNIPDLPAVADPQMAAGFLPGSAAAPFAQMGHPVAAVAGAFPGPAGMMPASSFQFSVFSFQLTACSVQTSSQAGPGPSLVVQRMDEAGGRGSSLAGSHAGLVLDAVLADLITDADRPRDGVDGGTNEVSRTPDAGDAQDGLGPDGTRSDEARPDPVSRPVEIPHAEDGLIGRRLPAVPVADVVLDELAAGAVGWTGWTTVESGAHSVPQPPVGPQPAAARSDEQDGRRETGRPLVVLAVAVLGAGSWSQRGRARRTRNPGHPPRV
jgi:hypothetical protein